jgi:hypothetical protein
VKEAGLKTQREKKVSCWITPTKASWIHPLVHTHDGRLVSKLFDGDIILFVYFLLGRFYSNKKGTYKLGLSKGIQVFCLSGALHIGIPQSHLFKISNAFLPKSHFYFFFLFYF